MASLLILSFFPAALSHSVGEGVMNIGAESGGDQAKKEQSYPATYFALKEYRALIYGHIALMMIAWVVLQPIGML